LRERALKEREKKMNIKENRERDRVCWFFFEEVEKKNLFKELDKEQT
jgi:hypothetical protein